MLNLAMARGFRKAPRTVARNHLAPERHRPWMTHIFDDFPIACEAVEYQRRGVPADSRAAKLHTNKELRHSIIRGFLPRLGNARTRNQRKAHRVSSFENQERVRLIVGKPIGEDLSFVRIVRADHGK